MVNTNDSRYENNSVSPWAYTNFHGMRLAKLITWMEPEWLTALEEHILVTLYGALVKGTDVIDRVTQEILAQRCRVSSRP